MEIWHKVVLLILFDEEDGERGPLNAGAAM